MVEEEGDLKDLLVKKMVVLDDEEALKVPPQREAIGAMAEEEQTDQIDLRENLMKTEILLISLGEDVEKIKIKTCIKTPQHIFTEVFFYAIKKRTSIVMFMQPSLYAIR